MEARLELSSPSREETVKDWRVYLALNGSSKRPVISVILAEPVPSNLAMSGYAPTSEPFMVMLSDPVGAVPFRKRTRRFDESLQIPYPVPLRASC